MSTLMHGNGVCRRLWQYAIQAVLQDLGRGARRVSLSSLPSWRQVRQQYIALYLQRQDSTSKGNGKSQVSAML